MTKLCRKCGTERDVAEFYRERRNSDGLHSYCKPCERERVRNHPTKRVRQARYYERNRDKILADHVQWREANPERMKELNKLWWASHPDFNRHHSQVRRARIRGATIAKFIPEQLAQRWAYYGDKCYLCGAPATASDHVKPLNRGGAHMLCNLRPICKPCNSRKSDKWPFTFIGRAAA